MNNSEDEPTILNYEELVIEVDTLTNMRVNGRITYRIHGTLGEKTIGSNESAGCIRMKNSDVLQLAALINDFSDIKGLNKVKVILK
jgi:hypothetical protein